MLRTASAVFAVFAGGLLGTALRLGIETLIPHAADELPLSTLLINVVGSFVLGVLVARVWPGAPDWLRAGVGPGVLGSFTTFSAVTVSLVALADADRMTLAAVYLGATLLLGFAAAAAGLATGRARHSRPGAGIR